MKKMAKLCVNIDHVATLRQARGGRVPDPLEAAKIAEKSGAIGITVHLREDRRHINDKDVDRLRRAVKTKLNLEMSLAPDIVKKALAVVPDEATIVPEKRLELTTEGGLDVIRNMRKLKPVVRKLAAKGVTVSLFIDADFRQIKAAKESGAQFVELHTGCYAGAKTKAEEKKELIKIKKAARYAASLGLGVNAGHGLNYGNTKPVARIPEIEDLNTGHSIISRAVLYGLDAAVRDMLKAMK
jgi:pyridoxine 5-phosphate synthase